MTISSSRTVSELAQDIPDASRMFEKLGIDYCCGGSKSLAEASAQAKVSIDEVLDSLEIAKQTARVKQKVPDWQIELMADLIAHIKGTHHKYTREELARLGQLLDKVCSVHGRNHPELQQIRTAFRGLAQELTMRMLKEETVLFPYILRMEEAVIQKKPILPPAFGTLRNPVAMMVREHHTADAALRTMRRLSDRYVPPADACISYTSLYQALADFEADLQQHVHLENNILFPRAIAMEEGALVA